MNDQLQLLQNAVLAASVEKIDWAIARAEWRRAHFFVSWREGACVCGTALAYQVVIQNRLTHAWIIVCNKCRGQFVNIDAVSKTASASLGAIC
jgi:hypothetical protein